MSNTNENLFPNTGKIYFDPEFEKFRRIRAEIAKKRREQIADPRYGYIERSIINPSGKAETKQDLAI